jgi:two-component sensor histidine kinase
MKKHVALFLFLFYLQSGASGQSTKRNTLSVPKFPATSSMAILDTLSAARSDTSKVWLLNKLATVFWWRRTSGSMDLDSCLYFAGQAKKLSTTLGFAAGLAEANFLLVKSLPYKNQVATAVGIITASPLDQRIRLNLAMAEYFLYLPENLKANAAHCRIYLEQALKLSRGTNLLHWKQESQIAMAKYQFLTGNTNQGIYYFKQVITYWHRQGNLAEEAHWWSDLGKYMPGGNRYLANLQLSYLKNAFNLYKQLGDKRETAYAADDMGFAFKELLNNLDSAEYYTAYCIKLLGEARVNKRYKYYAHLSEIYYRKGNFHQALAYSLASLRNMEELDDHQLSGIVNSGLGQIYYSLGDYQNSLKYFKSALAQLPVTDLYIGYYLAKYISDNHLALRQPAEALKFLVEFEKAHPSSNPVNKEVLLAAKANYYAQVKDFKAAEKYYRQMIALDKLSIAYSGPSWIRSIAGSEANYLLAKFYIDRERFSTGARYLNNIDTLNNFTPLIAKDVALLNFKVDSAAGRYRAALAHFQTYTAYRDSIYNIANAGKIADLQVKYETGQKIKDIRLLRQESQLQERRIAQSVQSKRFAFAGLAMLALVIGIGFNRYRLKQHSYQLLMHQQEQINAQNESLHSMNQKQTKLLGEKEWLIKEVHHRVKNNLQMMQSLLKVQGHYLGNEDASAAINTSRHRMHAMALVHQKLYLDNETEKIDIAGYIRELVTYLRDSFDDHGHIVYQQDLIRIELDIARAIPVGLIINELITNAIKHAFPDGQQGEISISLRLVGADIELQVADNGRGATHTLDLEGNQSFGFTLIRGLVSQLDGKIAYQFTPGLQAILVFRATADPGDPALL